MTITRNVKFEDLSGKETLTGPNTGKYCPGNSRRRRISHSHILNFSVCARLGVPPK